MKRRVLYVSVLCLCVLFAGSGAAVAEGGPGVGSGFTNASVQGVYAVTSINGDLGVIGHCTMDGAGSFDCSVHVNMPTEAGDRNVVATTSSGTYTVTAGGLVMAHELQGNPDGSTTPVDHLGVVVDVQAIGSHLLVKQWNDVALGPDQSTNYSTLKRLPDMSQAAGGFSNASLVGTYALSGQTGTGVAGICNMDGAGSLGCSITLLVPGENGEAMMIPASATGTYTVTADGMVALHHVDVAPDGSTFEGDEDTVVTDADAAGPYAVITALTDLGRQPDKTPSGTLAVATLRRLPDLADAGMMETAPMTETTPMSGTAFLLR